MSDMLEGNDDVVCQPSDTDTIEAQPKAPANETGPSSSLSRSPPGGVGDATTNPSEFCY
jgi:hypothetical protein